jgi:hypothetical protein
VSRFVRLENAAMEWFAAMTDSVSKPNVQRLNLAQTEKSVLMACVTKWLWPAVTMTENVPKAIIVTTSNVWMKIPVR